MLIVIRDIYLDSEKISVASTRLDFAMIDLGFVINLVFEKFTYTKLIQRIPGWDKRKNILKISDSVTY